MGSRPHLWGRAEPYLHLKHRAAPAGVQKCNITQGVAVQADHLNIYLPEMHNCLIFKPDSPNYLYLTEMHTKSLKCKI